MQHHDGRGLGVLRDLVEGVEVVAVKALAHGGRLVVVVIARGASHGTSDGEAALGLDHQRAGGRAGIVSGIVQAGGAATGEKCRGEGGDQEDAGCLHLIPSMRRPGPA